MYPTSKTRSRPSARGRRITGALLLSLVCLCTTGVVIYAIKKLAENEISKKTKSSPSVRTFTNNEAQGRLGPTSLKYEDPRMLSEVSLKEGFQIWNVPQSGLWKLEARGASGADGLLKGGKRMRGGWGALVSGAFLLKKDEKLRILVGQEGSRDFLHPQRPGGGGGGTFVVKMDGTPLLIAGGGGGGGIPPPAAFQTEGNGGRDSDRLPKGDKVSGHAGSGGKLLDTSTDRLIKDHSGGHKVIAGAGGGLKGRGGGYGPHWGGRSLAEGGAGGEPTPKYTDHTHGAHGVGGFGGGGAAGLLPGGGGGYSGGGVSGCWLQCDPGHEAGTAEGGSLFNAGMQPEGKANTHKGHGVVYAKLLSAD
ncbi:glycine-rich cell wall structural protein 1.0 [Nematostella vectensis]|uniref:glycine-rich cell wall structural protein 1.0 n=1 Tax=Nematostella vectensis TaxID=45351 RepID=UPI002076FDD1|nr:glycine-rich cell wall structural protein 1.0 [Nematostella vectensis]